MTADEARRWLIKATLILTGTTFLFLCLAPLFGYHLEWKDSIRVFEVVLPVFLGYLGTATQFVFQNMAGTRNTGIAGAATNPLLALLVRGPVWVFGLAIAAVLVSFGITNRFNAPAGSGMSVDTLAGVITVALGLLNVTTQVAVSYLFSLDGRPAQIQHPGLDAQIHSSAMGDQDGAARIAGSGDL
jgi:hypothetical protein